MAIYWLAEMFCAGLSKSFKLLNVIIHLKVGAQKKIVNGPAGWARKVRNGLGHGSDKTACCSAGTIIIYFSKHEM